MNNNPNETPIEQPMLPETSRRKKKRNKGKAIKTIAVSLASLLVCCFMVFQFRIYNMLKSNYSEGSYHTSNTRFLVPWNSKIRLLINRTKVLAAPFDPYIMAELHTVSFLSKDDPEQYNYYIQNLYSTIANCIANNDLADKYDCLPELKKMEIGAIDLLIDEGLTIYDIKDQMTKGINLIEALSTTKNSDIPKLIEELGQ